MNLINIFDGSLAPNTVNLSTRFKHGQFLVFDGNLPQGESYEIGIALNAVIPLIGSTVLKTWSSTEFLDTDEMISIPKEFSESDYEFYVAFGCSFPISNFRCYAITSDVTQETISEDLSQIQADIDLILQNQTTAFNLQTAIGVNELAQNTALSILGTGLAPLTAGVSAGVVPVLTGSQLLLLLPG
jgi:hypothetical protein